jgi:hypothetical protein
LDWIGWMEWEPVYGFQMPIMKEDTRIYHKDASERVNLLLLLINLLRVGGNGNKDGMYG